MRHSRVVLLPLLLLITGLMLAVGLAALKAEPVAAVPPIPLAPAGTPGLLDGFLYDPYGEPVAGGWIDIQDSEGDPWVGAVSGDDGYFYIVNLPEDSYTLRAYPPEGSPHAGSLPVTVAITAGGQTSQDMVLTEVSISGLVQDGDTADPLAGAFIVVHNEDWSVAQWDSSDGDGRFKVGGLSEGITYTLEAFPPPDTLYLTPEPLIVTPILTDVVVNLFIPPADVVGSVQDPDAEPVIEAAVSLYNDEFSDTTLTDEPSGEFAFYDLPAGEYSIQAAPPWLAQGLVPSEPFTITVPEAGTLYLDPINLPSANKTLTGQVLLNGVGVNDALVWANRLDEPSYAYAYTDENGYFSLALTGGEWNVGVEPADPPASWLFPGPPAYVLFNLDTEPETQEITLEVIPADGWVTGHIVCPGAVPCEGSPSPELLGVVLNNDAVSIEGSVSEGYTFTVPVPAGWYALTVYSGDPFYQGPAPLSIDVPAGEVVDVGDIELVLRDEAIIGRVYNEFGDGVAGVPVFAWSTDGASASWAESDENGYYYLPVTEGEWYVTVDPTHLPYVLLNQPPILVTVAPGGTVTGVNFVLTLADSRIKGVAVDSNTYRRIRGLSGWAWAERYTPASELEFFSDAPMNNGLFRLKARGGHHYQVTVAVPPEAAYVSGSTGPVYVPPSRRVLTYVPLRPKDAAIVGELVNALTGEPVPDVTAEIFGWDGFGNWASTGVDPETADYHLDVAAGTWWLNAWVDPHSGYVADHTPADVTVAAGEVAYQDFYLWPINTTISGYVTAPDGTPVAGAFVYAQGMSPYVGPFDAYTESDENGYFELAVLDGRYTVGASLPEDVLIEHGWLNPRPIFEVDVSHEHPVTDLSLSFRAIDALLYGLVTFAPGITIEPTHSAYVWAWAESGEWATARAVFSGTVAYYEMPVVSGVEWHVGAVYDDPDNGRYFLSTEATVPALEPGDFAQQDLELQGPYYLPNPLIISFDATSMQSITLPDGFHIEIPPGALAESGIVTLYIFPTAELRPEAGQQLIGPGYNLWATDANGREITHFNREVILSFPYPSDEELAAQGISELQLIPVYYSTLLSEWILADSYVLDADNNYITLQVSHFTQFATVAREMMAPTTIYLPVMMKP